MKKYLLDELCVEWQYILDVFIQPKGYNAFSMAEKDKVNVSRVFMMGCSQSPKTNSWT